MKRIVVLSGRIGAGKSALAEKLASRYGAHILKTHEIIEQVTKAEGYRGELQAAGERLDTETNGAWLAREMTKLDVPGDALLVVDSVRIEAQIDAIRETFGRIVTHIHLTAPESVLEARYRKRPPRFHEPESYAKASQNKTESQVETLANVCDVLIDTSSSTEQDVLVRAAARIGLYQLESGAAVDVIVGGEYGSEGKGNIASYLAPEYQYLIRVGGPNAGHKVIAPERTFRSLPSGTLHAPHAKVLIGPGATLHLSTLTTEMDACSITSERLSIDPQAMIIEDADKAAEQRLMEKIGSTGQGVGYAAARRLMRGLLEENVPVRLAGEVEELKPYVRPILDMLQQAYAEGARILLEGTQGTGLSLYHGHFPYVTSRDTTASGTMAEAGIPPARVRRVIMVCRTYPIRVGDPKGATSGPLEQEISWEILSERSGIDIGELRKVEVGSVTDRKRRVGEFEWHLFRKACSLNGPTDIALTFADYINAKNKDARRFEQLHEKTIRFIEELERVASAPVSLISTRFHARSIIDRRMW